MFLKKWKIIASKNIFLNSFKIPDKQAYTCEKKAIVFVKLNLNGHSKFYLLINMVSGPAELYLV